jgi:tetratricopeptide (TPR) repeat protein
MWAEALNQDSSLTVITDLLAGAYFAQGDNLESSKESLSRYELKNIGMDALIARLALFEATGDIENTRKALDTASEKLPNQWFLALAKSQTLLGQGMAAEALALAETADRLAPHVFAIKVNKARLLAFLERWHEAAIALEEIVKYWPDNTSIRWACQYLLAKRQFWDRSHSLARRNPRETGCRGAAP